MGCQDCLASGRRWPCEIVLPFPGLTVTRKASPCMTNRRQSILPSINQCHQPLPKGIIQISIDVPMLSINLVLI